MSSYEVAQRLAATFARSVPDEALLTAAADGSLLDGETRREHAQRLLDGTQGRAALVAFVTEWFGIDRLPESQLAQEDPMLAEGLARETEVFVEQLAATGSASFTELLSADHTYLSAAMADHYGYSLDESEAIGDGWFRVPLEDSAGILTQGSYLSQHTNPVHRGLAIRQTILCGTVPGPDDVDVTAVDTYEGEPKRSKSETRLDHPVCGSCHGRMDPIGLAFDGFDEQGIPRSVDAHGNPVMSDGELRSADTAGAVSGPAQLGRRLAESSDVRACVAQQLFAWSYGRSATGNDGCLLAGIENHLEMNDNDLREALLGMVSSDAFLTRTRGEL